MPGRAPTPNRRSAVVPSPVGPWCPEGGFHIDPWGSARRAIVTHAHSDHARWGSDVYLCSESCAPLLRERLGANAVIEGMPFGERRRIGDVTVSLHPAGHVLGSAQVRVEGADGVWVFSGDYKVMPDPTCEAFEPVRCDVFITESTFGLPVYRWPEPAKVVASILDWWRGNAAAGRTSVLFAYPLGKTQRLLGELARAGDLPGAVAVHGSGARLADIYRAAGRPLLDAPPASADVLKQLRGEGLLICPPLDEGTGPLKRLGETSCALASGWMRIRGVRRRRALDRGFAISDHADWPGLLQAIKDTGAGRVAVTHGYTGTFARYLREQGLDAWEFPTRYSGEVGEEAAEVTAEAAGEPPPPKRAARKTAPAPPKKRDSQAELPFD